LITEKRKPFSNFLSKKVICMQKFTPDKKNLEGMEDEVLVIYFFLCMIRKSWWRFPE
jgi:hypothetical protein